MPELKHKSKQTSSKAELIEKKNEEKQITLTDFVDENSKLISALGVFTALTVFSTNLTLKPYGYALSFAFMTLTVLLWLELWGKYPARRGSWRLTWFENILFLTVLAVVFYWLLEFRTIWHEFLQSLLFLIILAPIGYLIKKFDLFNRVFHTEPGKLKLFRYLLAILIGLVIMYISYYLANLIAPPLNTVLDQMREFINTTSP